MNGAAAGKSWVALILLCAAASHASSEKVPPGSWEKTNEKDGILVFRKEVPGSSVLAFKGEGDVPAPLSRVATVIFDTSRAPEWIPDLESSRIVKWFGPDEFLEYDHIGTPFVMKDRDFLSKVKMTVEPATRTLTFHYKSVEDADVPRTKYVRGDLMNTTFILSESEDGKRTHVLGEIHADPMGSVPKWIVNMFQKDWPIDTLQGLRKQASKPDVKDDPRFLEMFRPGFSFKRP